MDTPPDIRERRKHLGLSQQELARRANCSLSYLNMIENGFRAKDSEVIPRVVAALDEAERAAPAA